MEFIKCNYNFFFCLLCLIIVNRCTLSQNIASYSIEQKIQLPSLLKNKCPQIPIRVLLKKKESKQKFDFTVKSQNGFFVLFNESNKLRALKKIEILNITQVSGDFLINKENYKTSNLFIFPIKGFLEFDGNLYDGFFQISRSKDNIYLVNYLDLEDYVSAVLPSESWPGWPDDVNKALSICIRSYGFVKIMERSQLNNNRSKFLFDIENTTVHQVYKGAKDSLKFKNIANQTKGLVLVFQNKPILAMFDIACGGVIPNMMKEFDFNKAPYLDRSYPCKYCKNFKCSKWELTFTNLELTQKIKQIFPQFGIFKEIKLNEVDKAGIVHSIKIRGDKWYELTGKKLKAILNLKSLFFSIFKGKNSITFRGSGFGHLVGLCQFGLRQMVQDGWNYKTALRFYYPHTKLVKLTTSIN